MQSKASTVAEYLASLPDNRKKIITDLRKEIKRNLPKGFEEKMQYGMITYVVPHKLYVDGYHVNSKDPLPFISLASQKNHIALYHMMMYQGELKDWFVSAWKKTSDRKLDMGKCCIRFKKPEDIPIKLIGELAGKVTPQQWILTYEEAIRK